VREAVRGTVEGRLLTLVEFDGHNFAPLDVADETVALYEDEEDMMDHFRRVHDYVDLDFTELELFTTQLLPTEDRDRYIATRLDNLELVRFYRGEDGLFLASTTSRGRSPAPRAVPGGTPCSGPTGSRSTARPASRRCTTPRVWTWQPGDSTGSDLTEGGHVPSMSDPDAPDDDPSPGDGVGDPDPDATTDADTDAATDGTAPHADSTGGADGDATDRGGDGGDDAPVKPPTGIERRLDPRVQKLWLVRAVVPALFVGVLATIAGFVLRGWLWPGPAVFALSFALGGLHAFASYRRWRYEVREDALYLDRGVVTEVRTVVPYVRVQHVDVSRGPFERAFGLSSVVVYTAGSRGADVSVPGLGPDDADDLQAWLKRLAIEAEGDDAV
jgi:membrane protein YdbS with pleckstrin-like domain